MPYTYSIPVGKVAEGGAFSLFTRGDVFCGYEAGGDDCYEPMAENCSAYLN